MKKIITIFLFLLIFLSSVYSENYGIICGITDYQKIHDLDRCAEDAKLVYDSLIKSNNWKPENLKLLINSEATKENILNGVHSISSKIKDPAKDNFMFYFAGYIAADKDVAPLDEKDDLDEYIYLYDGNNISDDELGSFLLKGTQGGDLNHLILLDIYTPIMQLSDIEGDPLKKVDVYEELDFNNSLLTKKNTNLMMISCRNKMYVSSNTSTVPYYFNEALGSSKSDTNNDGWISAKECCEYLTPIVKSIRIFQTIEFRDNAKGTFNVVKSPEPPKPAKMNGDVNKDGKIDMVDVLLIGNYVTGQKVENFHVENADINCDKRVDIVDAFELIRKVNDPSYNIDCPASN